MRERRRKNKHYDIVPGDEIADDDGGEAELDDLGRAEAGLGAQETGTIAVELPPPQANGGAAKNVDVSEELDNWDENEEDWEEEGAEGARVAAGVGRDGAAEDGKKRVD